MGVRNADKLQKPLNRAVFAKAPMQRVENHVWFSARALEDVTTLTVTFQDHPQFKDPVLGQHRVMTNGLVEFDLTLRYRNRNQ